MEDYYAGAFRVDREEEFQNYNNYSLFTDAQRLLLTFNVLQRARYGDKQHQVGTQGTIAVFTGLADRCSAPRYKWSI